MSDIEPTGDVRVLSVFVYGTLKRGQCRESAWPAGPKEIVPGWVHGELWGRDDYPALLPGGHRVRGELYRYDGESIRDVLSALDEIEGTDGNSPSDLYHRHVVDAFRSAPAPADRVTGSDRETREERAYVYFYNRDPAADGFVRITPVAGWQSWP